MFQDRILLTPKDILEKEFKIDTRGYRPQEVDKFLDDVISDYEEMFSIIKELETRLSPPYSFSPRIPPTKSIRLLILGSAMSSTGASR